MLERSMNQSRHIGPFTRHLWHCDKCDKLWIRLTRFIDLLTKWAKILISMPTSWIEPRMSLLKHNRHVLGHCNIFYRLHKKQSTWTNIHEKQTEAAAHDHRAWVVQECLPKGAKSLRYFGIGFGDQSAILNRGALIVVLQIDAFQIVMQSQNAVHGWSVDTNIFVVHLLWC